MIHRLDAPDALALTCAGGAYETRTATGPLGPVEVFAHHPRTLQGLYRAAAGRPERKLVEHDGRSFTAGELFGQAAAVARWLEAQGIGKGDTIALALPGSPEWMASFIAVTALGGRAALVNTRGAGEEMHHAIRLAECAIVFADPDRIAALESAPEPWTGPLVRVGGEPRHGETAFADIVAGAPAALADWPDSDPDDGALVLFTSGTTGFPKGVLHTHGSLTHAAVLGGLQTDLQDFAYTREFGIAVPPERRSASAATVIAGPMFHMGGVTPFIRGLYFHAPIFIMSRWNAEAAFDLMTRETVSRLGFVPAMLLDMIQSPAAGPENLGSILHLASGAATLDESVVERIQARMPNVMISNSYGQTESAGWGTSIGGGDYLAHPTSVGRVLPTLEMRIAGDGGRDCAVGEPGEVLFRGASIMRGYVGADEATADTLAGGWLHTGDIGAVDADGRLFILDRKKNMVISGGENIYCAEIERVIGDYDGIAEVIAYGRPDERLGERIAATVVPRPGIAIDTEALRAYVRTRLAGYKVPRDIAVRASPLPRTPTMKVDRGTFLRLLED